MSRRKPRARRDPNSLSRYRWLAALTVAVLLVGTVAAFIKTNPFTSSFEVRAVFSTANQLHPGSEVRVAGFKVGEVDGISAGPGHASVVTMAIGGGALPLHTDATFTIKPRLALEGNGYVDVTAGSPAAPVLSSGATVPLAQTAVSVQIDQLLDVFSLPTRGALQRSVASLATGLGGTPAVHGAPGYAAFQQAVRALYQALPSVTTVATAARGTEAGDLTRAIGSSGDVAAQLAQSPQALAGIVTHYDNVFAVLAAQDRSLAGTISGIDALLKSAPPSLTAIDGALPALTSFANDLTPALRTAPAPLRAVSGLLDEFRTVVQPRQLPALLNRLQPVLTNLPTLEQRLRVMFGWSTPVTDCISTHVVPVLNQQVPDGAHSSGDPAWLDLMHAFTGFSSFSSAVDANGGTVRMGVTLTPGSLDEVLTGFGHVLGKFDNAEGVDPTWLGYGVSPQYRPDVPCATQALPNLAARAGTAPHWSQTAAPAPHGARR